MIDIQAMRKLHDASTKGEWQAEQRDEIANYISGVYREGDFICRALSADAAFIAEAHNKMAELLRLAEIGLKAQEQRKDGSV